MQIKTDNDKEKIKKVEREREKGQGSLVESTFRFIKARTISHSKIRIQNTLITLGFLRILNEMEAIGTCLFSVIQVFKY